MSPTSDQRILAVCLDFGDTLADEASEIKDESQTTQRAELIPGAAEMVRAIKQRGYWLALVADGRPGTYDNVLKQHGLHDYFDAFAVSELVGVEKPDQRMFLTALRRLGIAEQDFGRVIMVGNRLDRDVRGANDLGLISIWLNWAPRYEKEPADEREIPDYEIGMPLELLDVLDELDGRA